MPAITHAIIIAASPDKVYDAITLEEGLRGWWTPKASTKAVVNELARFPFGDEYFKEMKIVELIPSRLVKWTCLHGDNQWIGTTLSFNLEAGSISSLLEIHPEMRGQLEQQAGTNDATLLYFQHDHWEEATLMYAECNYTWAQFLRSLKLLCETGKGRPWPHQHSTEL